MATAAPRSTARQDARPCARNCSKPAPAKPTGSIRRLARWHPEDASAPLLRYPELLVRTIPPRRRRCRRSRRPTTSRHQRARARWKRVDFGLQGEPFQTVALLRFASGVHRQGDHEQSSKRIAVLPAKRPFECAKAHARSPRLAGSQRLKGDSRLISAPSHARQDDHAWRRRDVRRVEGRWNAHQIAPLCEEHDRSMH